MPITPIANGFFSDERDEEYENIIALAVDAIEEIRNKGSQIFNQIQKTENAVGYAFLVQSFYFRKLIEIIDTISILTKAKANCDSLLRTYFECIVYITHLYEKETDKRSLGFIYTLAVEKEFSNNKFNITTPSGKETLSALKKEGKSTLLDEYVPYTESVHIGLQSLRAIREFKEIEKEYNKTKLLVNKHPKQNGKRPEWYHLFDGSRCFKDLCFKLGFGGRYLIMFETLSQATHAHDIIQFNVVDGNAMYSLLRNTKDYVTTVNFIFLSSLKIFETYSKKLSLDEQNDYLSWAKWFGKEYQKVLVS